MICAGCNTTILVTQKRIKCCLSKCVHQYHLECVKYDEATTSRAKWTCPICVSGRPKLDNTNTPVHPKGHTVQTDQAGPVTQMGTMHSSISGLSNSQNKPSLKPVLGQRLPPAEKSPPVATRAARVETEVNLQDTILTEIRKLRREMNEKFDSQQASLAKFETTLATVRKEVNDLSLRFSSMYEDFDEFKKTVSFLSDAHDEQVELNARNKNFITELLQNNATMSTQVRELETRLEQIDQLARENNVEIQCIPEHKTENLLTIVKQVGRVVGNELQDSEIQSFHRVAKLNEETNRPRSIVVKLASPRVRDNLLAAVRNFNKKNELEKLNSSHIGIGGAKQPIFVTENLTLANKKLHAATRIAAKEKKYNFVWVRNGRIFVRKDVTTKSLLVKNFKCLESL